ncbi:MAG TPA: phospholipase D family protein [Candidatus Binataceae bacterium]|nr:phospholipase D family protein [Candidatus Binataceae bacterium]
MTARGGFRNREERGLRGRLKRSAPALAAFAAALVFAAVVPATNAFAAQIEVCFSPPLPGGCDPARAIEAAVGVAHTSILVQAYEITPGPLVNVLIEAHQRGVDVRAIVDYRQLTDRRNHDDAFAVEHLAAAGIPVLVDRPRGIMHDKVMIIDGEVVVTGSFNYTYSAEHRNVENLLVIHDPALAAQYTQHWRSRASESRPLRASASIGSGQSSVAQNSAAQNSMTMDSAASPLAPNGPIIGNRRSRIYEWPGCPGYNKISAANRVQFLNAPAAEQAGYRAARNCR